MNPDLYVLVSRDYRHLVNVNMKRMLIPFPRKEGHHAGFEIATPQEVIGEGE